MAKKKWLSVLLAVMFVLSIIPTAIFATGATEIVIEDADDLAAAIAGQQADQTWIMKENTYVLTQEHLNQYASWNEPGQDKWYFPIHEDGITIVGEGNVVITSDVETPNGVWATQDFITIWSDNVTLRNLSIKSKVETNKAIEISGKNATLEGLKLLRSGDEWNWSGSIVFNSDDIGTATMKDVELCGWVSANYAKAGTLNAENVTIDFTDTAYSGFNQDGAYLWNPGIHNFNSAGVTVNNTNLSILVDSNINLNEQIFNGKAQPETTIVLTEDVAVGKMLDLTTDNTTLDLNGHTITATEDFYSTFPNDAHLLQVNGAENVVIKNGSLVSTDLNKHTVNVYQSQNVTLDGLTIDNTHTMGGCPVVVNASSVNVEGDLALTVGVMSWEGINVDPK